VPLDRRHDLRSNDTVNREMTGLVLCLKRMLDASVASVNAEVGVQREAASIQPAARGEPNEPTRFVVLHKSMPFQDLQHTPYLHDLPLLAERLGGWTSRLVIVLRDIPSKCASRPFGVTRDIGWNLNYLNHIEALLNRSSAMRKHIDSVGLPVAFIR
jgi:hypothetical protein